MAEAIVTRFRGLVNQKHPIEEILLMPAGKGIFDVYAGEELIYSKYETGRHAEHGEVLASVQRLLGSG